MHIELESLQDKLEDAENRACRDNLCIRGLPETLTEGTAIAFFRSLQLTFPPEHLEFDRIHRSLAPKPSEGPPRDVIFKLHYYCTKKRLLRAASDCQDLSFQGNSLQLFADLSPVTIVKTEEPKALSASLTNPGDPVQVGVPL